MFVIRHSHGDVYELLLGELVDYEARDFHKFSVVVNDHGVPARNNKVTVCSHYMKYFDTSTGQLHNPVVIVGRFLEFFRFELS